MSNSEVVVEEEAERVALNLSLHIAAADGNYNECQTLLKEEGADAWWEDENVLNWSALHFAAEGGHTKVVKLLLRSGALWNAVDSLGMTAAEVAWSYNDDKTYRAILEEGVRQTVIQNLLGRKQPSDEEEAAAANNGGSIKVDDKGNSSLVLRPSESANEVSASNDDFLTSRLSFIRDKEGKERCVDVDGGLVMAAWETDIMQKTAAMLCKNQKPGFSVLNVGFGLGIIDEIFQSYGPGRHVIVEAHPDAIAYAKSKKFDDRIGVELVFKRWEDAITEIGDFDVVYWDTFAQNYQGESRQRGEHQRGYHLIRPAELRQFFEEIPNLLSGPDARFAFFHGLAGTNQFLYDVYTRVAEVDLCEIGLVTTWEEIRPQITEETWKGIKRKYWSLDVHHIPICRMNLF